MGLIRKRTRIMGLPIGPQKTNWGGLAKAAIGTAAAVGGTGVVGKARNAMQTAREKAADAAGGGGDDGDQRDDDDRAQANGRSESDEKMQRPGDDEPTQEQGGGTAAGDDTESEGDGGNGSQVDNVKKQRLIIREQIDVGVPRKVAYNQWTQFEDFPGIFKGIESAEQRDDATLVMRGRIFKFSRQWTARIVEQAPDERIRWVVRGGGVNHTGVVTFHELDRNLTRIHVEMEYFPSGIMEKIGNLFLTVRHRVRKDLRLFKHFIELEGRETGAWRGEIGSGDAADEEPAAEATDREHATSDAGQVDGDRDERGADDAAERAEADEDESRQGGDGGPERGEDGRFVSSSKNEKKPAKEKETSGASG